MKLHTCNSGKHSWHSRDDARRCCNGYVRHRVVGRTNVNTFKAEIRGWVDGEPYGYTLVRVLTHRALAKGA